MPQGRLLNRRRVRPVGRYGRLGGSWRHWIGGWHRCLVTFSASDGYAPHTLGQDTEQGAAFESGFLLYADVLPACSGCGYDGAP